MVRVWRIDTVEFGSWHVNYFPNHCSNLPEKNNLTENGLFCIDGSRKR